MKLNKIKNFFQKIPRVAAEHAFFTFLVLVFIALIFGGILFYKYSVLAQRAEPGITEEVVQFKESLYQEILEEWKAQETRFEGTDTKEYPDPFR